MKLPEGREIFYRAWRPDRPTNCAVILFHRGHEHSGRMIDVVEELALGDVHVFAPDARGHGRSQHRSDRAASFASLVRDVDDFVRHVAKANDIPLRNIIIVGQSVGAVAVATWVHDYAPPIRAMVLVTPAFHIKLYVPFAISGLRLLNKLKRGKACVKSYVNASMLTHDPEQARRYNDDPLTTKSIPVRILLGLHDTSARLIQDAGSIRVPTLLLAADADHVVQLDAQKEFFERLGSEKKDMRVFGGMYHDILHEKDRHTVLDAVGKFIAERFERSDSSPRVDADPMGSNKNADVRLTRPLALLSPKSIGFAAQRFTMKTVGRLSCGIGLGWRTGFDSGKTLDYVYENRARGSLLIGKWIDRLYLNSIGWKGIRQRRKNFKAMFLEATRRVRGSGQQLKVLDIAAGPGRYLLESIKSLNDEKISVVLRDNEAANLEAGRKLARELALNGVRFELGDAFDEVSLASIDPPPNVAVVSGLYELFADNEMVARSLRGLARGMRDGGYLVYTNQPSHPQLEMIARVLVNREGAPWVMRCRSQAEMDDLVRAAGFEKLEMRIDDYGIFSVSLARIGDVPAKSFSRE